MRGGVVIERLEVRVLRLVWEGGDHLERRDEVTMGSHRSGKVGFGVSTVVVMLERVRPY